MRRTIFRVTAVAVGLLLALALAETTLRIHNPFAPRVRGDRITLPVNQRIIVTTAPDDRLSPRIEHRRNNLGFRGENAPASLDGRLSIIAVGGSTTECFFLTEGATWVDRLGERLRGHHPNLWINNAGLDGHSTHGHLILLHQVIAPIRPDVVLLLVGANEIGRQDLREFRYDDFRKYAEPQRASELWATVQAATRFARAVRMEATHRSIEPTEQSALAVTTEQRRIVLESHRDSLVRFSDRLNALLNSCESGGIMPVLLTQPALYGPAVDDRTGVDLSRVKVREGIDGALAWEILEAYNSVTRQTGESRHTLVIDLAAEIPHSSHLFYDWHHFTEDGARVVTDVVAAQLLPALSLPHSD